MHYGAAAHVGVQEPPQPLGTDGVQKRVHVWMQMVDEVFTRQGLKVRIRTFKHKNR